MSFRHFIHCPVHGQVAMDGPQVLRKHRVGESASGHEWITLVIECSHEGQCQIVPGWGLDAMGLACCGEHLDDSENQSCAIRFRIVEQNSAHSIDVLGEELEGGVEQDVAEDLSPLLRRELPPKVFGRHSDTVGAVGATAGASAAKTAEKKERSRRGRRVSNRSRQFFGCFALFLCRRAT
ncbi:unnamed protein product [Effrenium voratum]|nr:unnamed protein product [Effrenium voratum]